VETELDGLDVALETDLLSSSPPNSFVSWGLERDVAWKWWAKLSKPTGFEIGKYSKMEDESLDFFVDPAE